MIFNDDYNQIFKDQSSTFLSLPNLNSTLVLSNSISTELVPVSNIDTNSISNKEFLIEEMDEAYSDGLDSEESKPVIEEVEDELIEEDVKKKYSDIFFDIDIGEKCHSCSLDSYTLIQKDENLFHKFLNTSHIFQQSLFNFMKNLITNQ